MVREIPRIPVDPRNIGLFVAVAVLLGWFAGTPDATYAVVSNRSTPGVVSTVLYPLFALSPLVAAAIVVRRLGIDGGVRPFLRNRFRWRADARWYLIAIGLMPTLSIVTYLAFIAIDEPVPVERSFLGLLLLEIVLQGLVFNLVENYGWRGFLQEALQSHVSALAATLTVGVVWGLWHASLFLPGGQFEGFPTVAFSLVIVGEAVVIGWVYNSTGGSVLLATLMHTSFNASFGALVTLMLLAELSVGTFYWMIAVVIWLTVALIVLRTDFATLRSSRGPLSAG